MILLIPNIPKEFVTNLLNLSASIKSKTLFRQSQPKKSNLPFRSNSDSKNKFSSTIDSNNSNNKFKKYMDQPYQTSLPNFHSTRSQNFKKLIESPNINKK